jgi:hypothetical protein
MYWSFAPNAPNLVAWNMLTYDASDNLGLNDGRTFNRDLATRRGGLVRHARQDGRRRMVALQPTSHRHDEGIQTYSTLQVCKRRDYLTAKLFIPTGQ